jgi:hypothetical protein
MSDTQNRIEDLEEKIETLEDQLTSVRKVTPLHDITWYVKWISVFFVCCAVLCRSIEEVPKVYDVFFSIIGTAGWLWYFLDRSAKHSTTHKEYRYPFHIPSDVVQGCYLTNTG